ncbi:MAG: GTP cyclohydrolase I FolE [Chloroflexi bacterium]|nr:GTP cyclohydrolase I FolE [Chloroflexota bacterium]
MKGIPRFQEGRARRSVAALLQAIGEDPEREGLRDTPRRVAEMYRELFAGLGKDPRDELSVGFAEEHQGVVLLRDIPFFSMCEHHLLPFFGHAHIGYVPSGRVVGASKLVRAFEVLAHRPQLQERLTHQMAEALEAALRPEGVGVVVAAEHLCMTMRGVKKPGTLIVTSAARGSFATSPVSRGELLTLLQASRGG